MLLDSMASKEWKLLFLLVNFKIGFSYDGFHTLFSMRIPSGVPFRPGLAVARRTSRLSLRLFNRSLLFPPKCKL
jgi:hypothetical protein